MNRNCFSTIAAVVFTAVLVSCGGGTDPAATTSQPRPSIQASVASPVKKAATVTGGNGVVIHMYQALYGMAPSNAVHLDYASQANNDASLFAKNLADRFTTTGHADLAKLVLDNLGVTPTTVPAINARGESEYGLLLDAVKQLFAVYPTMRGQVILNMTNLLPMLGTDATYGAAAISFNQQTSVNFTYSQNSTVKVAAIVLPAAPVTTTWTGNVLEGAIDYCTNRSIRWIAPISGFDVNKDGVTDFIMPISCYQGPDPLPNEKHNRQIISAWKMWCSKPDQSYYDCTQDKFGTAAINATGTNSGGGNPYIHVIEQPFDINNDGYPDFWYALNRDDGRPGFDFNNPDDVKLLTMFCGPHMPNDWEWDCTRKSNQSVLLSQADGSYKVAFIPWGPTNTQAMVMLPNLVGTYDAFSFNYGTWRAARLINNAFVDVTTEYKSYQNIDVIGLGDPYVRVFKSDGVTYLVMPGIPSQHADADIASKNGTWGFTLWKWTPGVGFALSDYYKPAAENVFIYNEQSGTTSVKRYGAYIRGVATFTPRWHFFRYTTLDPTEGPILVVSQEAGSTAGKYYKAAVDSNAIYSSYSYVSPNNQYRYTEQSPIEAFYIQNGRIVPRLKSVIDGDVVWNTMPMFEDLNGDGYTDAIGVSGHSQRGSVFINDTKGVLHKMYTATSLPSYTNTSSWTIRNFGDSTNLGLLYWGQGFNTLPAWAGTTYVVPDVTLVQGKIPIDSLPIHTPELMQSEIQTCLTNMTWIDQCGFE
jgi:hypothetical protein